MIVWLNGPHGVGKTTTSARLAALLPGARVLDAEKVGETLMDVAPPLPDLGDFQHWPPWRPLVVETAWRVHRYAGGVLVMPMTVLVERYWREIERGLAAHRVPLRHVLLHADTATLRGRIAGDEVLGPSDFRVSRVAPYEAARRGWLGREAEVVDTTGLTPDEVAAAVRALLD